MLQRFPQSQEEQLVAREAALDDVCSCNESMEFDDMGKLHHASLEWRSGHYLSVISFTNLYVFADEYNIPQLRDDISTALIAQSVAWD